MVGNVAEWVADWYSATYYSESPAANPTGPTSGEDRVLRGSSFRNIKLYLTTFYRRVAAWAAERDWLRLAFLRLDGRPLAFDLALETAFAPRRTALEVALSLS